MAVTSKGKIYEPPKQGCTDPRLASCSKKEAIRIRKEWEKRQVKISKMYDKIIGDGVDRGTSKKKLISAEDKIRLLIDKWAQALALKDKKLAKDLETKIEQLKEVFESLKKRECV